MSCRVKNKIGMKHVKKNPGGEKLETSASVTYVSLTKIISKS